VSLVGMFVAVFAVGVGSIGLSVFGSSFGPADVLGGATGETRAVEAVTSTGRQGAYYLPAGHESRTLPVLVFFHGAGGKGSLAILRLRSHAEQKGFVVLAPDSVSVAGVWTIGQWPGDMTGDRNHVMTCVREILAAPGVKIDLGRVLAAGFSVGGN